MPDKIVPDASDPVATLVFFLLVFGVVGVVFLFFHLVMGSVIRPSKPDAEKLTIYECGEPTVGSAWIQFDLRFYVVALLFVIFDVEVAFFFPWAVVFGSANQLANPNLDPERREQLSKQLVPAGVAMGQRHDMKLTTATAGPSKTSKHHETVNLITPEDAAPWAHYAFWELMTFFAVLLVGFAYVWRRGDIDWVRAYSPHKEAPAQPQKVVEQEKVAV
ncbi:MAG: NADH-quinone oxidoreductase subunit A [Planctomycetes bacterium]|nr:NADH-quinone oxidoreductase subunit A [Planctomycetota bacterium]